MAQNSPSFFSRFGSQPAPPSTTEKHRPRPKRRPSRAVLAENAPMHPAPAKPSPEPGTTYVPSRPAPRPPARSNSTSAAMDPASAVLRNLSLKNVSTSSVSANAGSSASSHPVSALPAHARPLSPRQLGKRPAHSPLPQLVRNPSINPLPTPPKPVPAPGQASSSSTRATPSPVPPPPPIPPATSPPPVQKTASDGAPRNWNPYRSVTPDPKRHLPSRRPSVSVLPKADASKVKAPVNQQPPPAPQHQLPRSRSSDDITSNLARMILTPPHTQRMVTYPGTSQYAAGAPSACGLTSLNAVRCALQLEQAIRAGGGTPGSAAVGMMLLGNMTKLDFVKDVMGIAPHWTSTDHLEVEDVLGMPMFERSLTCIGTEQRTTSKKNFREILAVLQSTRTNTSAAAGVIITRPPEIISILHFPAALPSPPPATFTQSTNTPQPPLQHVFAIFDSHPRPTHPTGSAFVVSASIDQTARYLEKLFAVDPEVLLDGGALLGAFDAHFVVAGDHPLPPSRAHSAPGVGLYLQPTDPDVYSANVGMLHAALEARAVRIQARREVEAVLEQLRRSEAAYLRERRLREARDSKVRELEVRVRELEAREERREQRKARRAAREASEDKVESAPVPVEEGKDPLTILTPDEKGSLFGGEEAEKKSEAETAKAEEGEKEGEAEEEAGKNNEGEAKEETKDEAKDEAKSDTPTADQGAQRTSTGSAWGVLSSLAGRGIPFWSSSPSPVAAVDPVTIPTPLTPKAPLLPIHDDSISVPEITFHCDICQDTEPEIDVAIVEGCGHRFGRDCLKGFISSRLADGKFPILCPTCAAEGANGAELGVVSSWLAESVGISEGEFARWTQFELAAYSFALECTQCARSYMVSRDDYNDPSTKEFRCAMPDCDHVWCKSCSTTIEKGHTHTCDGSAELTRLMEKEGWKTCPGCNTPIEKNEGCNHISVSVCVERRFQNPDESLVHNARMQHALLLCLRRQSDPVSVAVPVGPTLIKRASASLLFRLAFDSSFTLFALGPSTTTAMPLHNPHQRLAKRLLPRFSPTWFGDPAPQPTTPPAGISAVGPPAVVTPTSAAASPTSTQAAPTSAAAQTTTQQASPAPANTPTTTAAGTTSAAPTSSTTPLTSSTDLVSTPSAGSTASVLSNTSPTTSSTTPLATSTTPRASAAQATSAPGTVTVRPSSVGIKTLTNASGGIIYSTVIEPPEPTASAPAAPSHVGTIVGAIAGGLVGVVCLIAFISWLVRQHNKRNRGNSDDFDRQSYLRNSMMIPDEAPGAGRPVIGTQAALALARANTVGPRPPTMIERKPAYLMTGQPSPSYAPGQVVSFDPGQIVSAPSSSGGHGYPSPMAFAGYTPPAEHHQSELSRRPSGAQLLTRQPTNGGMYDQGYQQNSPAGYSPDHYHGGYTYPMHPPAADRGMIQSVTPFQAQQYAEITRQLEGHPTDMGSQSFHPISPIEPVGYAISEEPEESRHGSAQSHEKGLPNPFDEKTARIDSTPPMLPPLGVDDGRLSRTGTPIDPNPQHAHWSYDVKAGQPGTRLSVAGMPTPGANLPAMPPAAHTREDRAVIVGNGEAMPARGNGKRPVSLVDEDDVYGGM
ncbi:hypothetical protein FRC10_011816 [Ceratobasidium sp. 414]|nr:hypothetical protein FRC10_011816 [Ceratobasidium sp. 414]